MDKQIKYLTKILPSTPEALTFACRLISEGEVVAVPTETVYGLAANATNSSAIEKIYTAKERPQHNPLIVHVGREYNSIEALVACSYINLSGFTKKSKNLISSLILNFWPGPLTLVLPRGEKISPTVARGLKTVGFRMPNNKIFLDLIEKSAVPLAAPSANKANSISPTKAEHVYQELKGDIPLILEGDQSQIGIESTILSVSPEGSLQLLRPGGVPIEKIEQITSCKVAREFESHKKIQAPGMMSLHYSPKKPLFLLHKVAEEIVTDFFDLLVIGDFSLDLLKEKYPNSQVTPLPYDDKIVAQKLFETLRNLDQTSSQGIVVFLKKQNSGLWLGINDRLFRASHDNYLDKK